MAIRIGFGLDVHPLVTERDLWLGGIKIPHDKGALGHSDADVLLHAICDALLGALSLGDIGVQFPDTDPQYKNISSKILLQRSYQLIKDRNYRVVNIDSFVCLEKPKIKIYTEQMRDVISSILEIQKDDVSVKATTYEKLGFVGREEGIVAHAVVLLEAVGNQLGAVSF